MIYEVNIPADVDQRLTERASETGRDISHLIRLAVVQFVDRHEQGPSQRRLLPDLPIDSLDISVPTDLPMADKRHSIDVVVAASSNLRPDPILAVE